MSRSLNYESYLKGQVVFVPRECVFLLLAPEAHDSFISVVEKDGVPGAPSE